jgi:hypothetical protein
MPASKNLACYMNPTAPIWLMTAKLCRNKLVEWRRLGKISHWQNTCSHQKREHKQQKQKEQNELHEMAMKQVQQMIKDMFKQPHQHHHLDDDSGWYWWSSPCRSNGKHHGEWMAALICLTCVNHQLKRLHKTQHFAPITTALLETHLGKTSIH